VQAELDTRRAVSPDSSMPTSRGAHSAWTLDRAVAEIMFHKDQVQVVGERVRAEARKTRALQAELGRIKADRQRQLKLVEIEAAADCGKIQHQLRIISREFETLLQDRSYQSYSSEQGSDGLEKVKQRLAQIEREYDDLLQEFANSVGSAFGFVSHQFCLTPQIDVKNRDISCADCLPLFSHFDAMSFFCASFCQIRRGLAIPQMSTDFYKGSEAPLLFQLIKCSKPWQQ
jgi:hypothetical protein